MNDKEVIERLNRFKTIKVMYGNTFAMHLEQLKQLQQDLEIILNLIENQKAEIEKKDKMIDLMAEDKYENINMIQMANIGKEVNYDPTKLFSGIPDEEVIKIIKQYYEKKVEEDK